MYLSVGPRIKQIDIVYNYGKERFLAVYSSTYLTVSEFTSEVAYHLRVSFDHTEAVGRKHGLTTHGSKDIHVPEYIIYNCKHSHDSNVPEKGPKNAY